MIIDNKLDKVFGPVGTFAGFVLIIFGAVNMVSAGSIFLMILGTFTSFTVTGTELDTEKRKVRYYNKIFGLFKTGKWHDLGLLKGIRVIHSVKSYISYSLSNRSLNIHQKDYRILLQGKNPKDKLPLMKCRSYEEAGYEAKKLAELLSLTLLK